MAGFETIVRPSVLPNIRPSPARKIASFDNPAQGFAVIHGNPAKQVNLTKTTSITITRSSGTEIQRRVDVARVFQVDDDGNVDRDNFVDIEVTNRMRVKTGEGRETRYYKRAEDSDNIEIQEQDKIVTNPSIQSGP